MKPSKAVGIQYAALPYRIVGRRVELMLVTSRQTRRWVIPKGWPMRGLSPPAAAAVEAQEEAGLIGEIDPKPIGSFRYLKRIKADRIIAVQVIVFPLLVLGQAAEWKEQAERDARWFPYQRAATLLSDVNLRKLVREFGKEHTPGLLKSLSILPPKWSGRFLGGAGV